MSHRRTDWLWADISNSAPVVCTISPRTCPHEIDPDLVEIRSTIVASFNWLVRERGGPVMLVPGCPQEYGRWRGGQLRSPARHAMFIDQNGAMNPQYPLESLIRAVDLCNQLVKRQRDFHWQSIDICTDRNNLRKLYSIASGQRKKRDGPIRIDLERVGQIVMLTRLEPRYKAFDSKGNFGHSFEHQATRPIPGAGHSNRVGDGSFRCIKLVEFGGLKILVRFEVDAADYGNVGKTFREQIGFSMANAAKPQRFDNESHLSYTVVPGMVISTKPDRSNLSLPVERLSGLVELTTGNNSGCKAKKWPQMYFSGTEKLVIARHKDGFVDRIEEFSLSEVEERIGGRPVAKLQQMAKLLQSLVEFVRSQPESHLFTAIWQPSISSDTDMASSSLDELHIFRRKNNAYTRVAPTSVLQSMKN